MIIEILRMPAPKRVKPLLQRTPCNPGCSNATWTAFVVIPRKNTAQLPPVQHVQQQHLPALERLLDALEMVRVTRSEVAHCAPQLYDAGGHLRCM